MYALLNEYKQLDLKRRIVWFSVGFFPVISTSVPSGGSILYTLLILPALFQAWPYLKRLDRNTQYWLASYIALFIWGCISLLYTEAINDGVERLERLFRLASLGILVLWLARLRIDCGRIFLFGIGAAAFVLLVQSILAVYANYSPLLHDGLRVKGLYSPIIFGDLAMLIACLLLVATFTVAIKGWHYALLIAGVGISIYSSAMTYTRGAWILLPAVLVLFLLIYRNKISRTQWLVVISALILAALSITAIFPKKIEYRIAQAIDEVALYIENPTIRTSTGLRLSLWHSSLQMWKGSPIVGVGLGDLQLENNKLIEKGIATNKDIGEFGHAHSIYFDTLATLGLVGITLMILALFIFPFRWFFHYWVKAQDKWSHFYALSGLVTITAFAVFGLTEGWLSRNPMVNPYVFYVATFASALLVRDAGKNASLTSQYRSV